MYPAPHIHEHLATANCVHPHAQHEQPGATLRTMARTPQSTLTCTMRSSEHAAHRLLMHSVHTSHLWLKVSPCVSFHVIHAWRTCVLSLEWSLLTRLSTSSSSSSSQLYLMSISAPDEISMEDPLCNSSLGSMVTLDYVTPLTEHACTLLDVLSSSHMCHIHIGSSRLLSLSPSSPYHP